jgi:hypothetical protein
MHLKSFQLQPVRLLTVTEIKTQYNIIFKENQQITALKTYLLIQEPTKFGGLPSSEKYLGSLVDMWYVARMGEERGVYRVLVGKPEGKRPLGRPRRRWVDNIKMDLLEVGCRTGLGWPRIETGGGRL